MAVKQNALLRLNLGCGQNKLPGYVNVDIYGSPDVNHDLETAPWPFDESSAAEICMNHVLEHLGGTSAAFVGIMRELYRVAAPGCRIYIAVPHPRHDDFLGDPTHVRPVSPATLEHFSMKRCFEWRARSEANSPLAMYLDVDFEMVEASLIIEEPYWQRHQRGDLAREELMQLVRERNNIAKEWRMTLQVIKPPRRALEEA